MLCEQVADELPRIVDNGEIASKELRSHVESCLHCQAELVHYRKLLRTLHNLRTEVLEPAPGFVADTLARIERAGERSAVRSILSSRKTAYYGGAAVATAAGVAGAIIFAGRMRKSKVA